MADFPLQLEAPDRGWAEHVATLIQRALGERGSVSIGAPPEALPDHVPPVGYLVTGVAVCDEPADDMLALIRPALVDYEVEERLGPGGTTQLIVRPPA